METITLLIITLFFIMPSATFGATFIHPHEKISGSSRYDKPDVKWEEIVCGLIIGPFDCLIAHNNAKQALATAEQLYPGYKLHNDEADAFRHCFWSALMTIYIGVTQAKIVGDNHEYLNDNPQNERHMDLYNNAIGLQVGLKTGTPDEAKKKCVEYARAQILHIYP
ncbi:hypothetical protein I4U23_027330 [Adineta vaga]|nr:hypothetical protein I4U23_027330 [Adineta vaga]